MSMRLTMVLRPDGGFVYRGSCANCSFVSAPSEDEDETYWQWMDHGCG